MNEEQILEQLGLSNLSDEEKRLVMTAFNDVVEKRVAGLIDDTMSKDQQAEFAKKSKSLSEEELEKWVNENVVNIDGLREEVTKDYIAEKLQK